MPEKSVREMGEFERLHHSLAARVFHAVMMGAAIRLQADMLPNIFPAFPEREEFDDLTMLCLEYKGPEKG